MIFSILHSSARPDQWRKVYDAWMGAATHPELVEYVLCVDERWGFPGLSEFRPSLFPYGGNLVVVWNDQRRCYVDGVNKAAAASHGRVLIVNADDQFPCDAWDERLVQVLERRAAQLAGAGNDPAKWPDGVFDGSAWPLDFVIEVQTGTPAEHERGILVLPILSRSRYEKHGYVFYPEFESMYADNDFCEHARQDGVIIDARELPVFPHRHPLFDPSLRKPGVPWQETDAAYKAQNSPEAYRTGAEIFRRRQRMKFAVLTEAQPTIALCLTGEMFHGEYLDAIMTLYAHLISRGFAVWRSREYTTNVYISREQVRRVMMALEPKADFFLWIDDDNPAPTAAQFDRLLAQLEAHPDYDGITGWCWIYDNDLQSFKCSAGLWSPDNRHWRPFDYYFSLEKEVRDVEASGFPCFLMKRSALEKAGDGAFLPILDPVYEHGLMGEDHAFLHRAQDGGAKFLVDPTVRVRHLKYCEAGPELPQIRRPHPRVAVMTRVRNEARWIARTIESVKGLVCNADAGYPAIFVLDDGSTDGTADLARLAGAVVIDSPFACMALDERRDKNFFLDYVKAQVSGLDWVLCIDGDEELEPDGAEKILRVLRTEPGADCFSLPVLNFWDGVDQVRTDGVYGRMGRQSLFRAVDGVEFRSYYEGLPGTNHCGLHVSNAPRDLKTESLCVFLLHYGYLHKADRIRKYRWILTFDAENEHEDRYRHTVQGDMPDVPADAVLKHGGPLRVRKLPARMVPRFAELPGPIAGADPRPVVVEVSR